MIKIGVIGFGYWGPNLVRNFAHNEKCVMKTVVDKDKSRLKAVKKLYPNVEVSSNIDTMLKDPDIDAVAIATPINTHYELAKKALLAGKHVLVEKPLTNSKKHAAELIEIAEANKLALMVDHIYLYNGAIRKMKDIISKGKIGKIQYFDSIRVNLGLFQHDSNVLWDLAVHDMSILYYLIDEKPYSVIATGISHTKNMIENIAYITLNFTSGMIAHMNCSWTAPVKIRHILIGGSKKMILYNDVEPTEKIKVYDTKFKILEREKMLVDYRIGDIVIPKFDQVEALKAGINDFLDAISGKRAPVSDGKSGLAIIEVLEAAEKSIKNNGIEVFLDESNKHRKRKTKNKKR